MTADDRERVNALKDQINSQAKTECESFEVVAASHQSVAGTNHFYHLVGRPGDKKLTVTVFEPLPHSNLPSSVSGVSSGHNELSLGHDQK